MAELKIGRVTHFYDKIGVAVVELTSSIGVGDRVVSLQGVELTVRSPSYVFGRAHLHPRDAADRFLAVQALRKALQPKLPLESDAVNSVDVLIDRFGGIRGPDFYCSE